MIIKPNAQAGGPWVGTLTQEDIDRTTEAFKNTWPRTYVPIPLCYSPDAVPCSKEAISSVIR